jgi:hypothetical protein
MRIVFDWAIIGGGTIIPLSLGHTGYKKICQARPNVFLIIIYDPFIFAHNSFSKI